MRELRRDYRFGTLSPEALTECPFAMFRTWFDFVLEQDVPEWFEANAMTLSTADSMGKVTSRIVLLKHFDETGFVFFTNYRSRKSQQIEQNRQVALNFFWPVVDRQVCVTGEVQKVQSELSDEYFVSRPLGSQVGAVLSPQSAEIPMDRDLELEQKEYLERHTGSQSLKRPEHWGGFRAIPLSIEFWQGKPSRLHDRFQYYRNSIEDSAWKVRRLGP